MQGTAHQTPKTLAIVDTIKYKVFSTAWNNLSREIKNLMAVDDTEVGIAFGRARASACSFASVYDEANSKDKSSVDMFGLIQQFQMLCNPTSGTNWVTLLSQATAAYAGIFIDRQTGPGTPTSLTGVHVFLPSKVRYYSFKDCNYDNLLFDNAVTATTSAPEWLNLLRAYYSSGTPPTGGSSACSTSTGGTDTTSTGNLLARALLEGSITTGMTLSATVTRSVDNIFCGIRCESDTSIVKQSLQMKRSDNILDTEEHPRYKGRPPSSTDRSGLLLSIFSNTGTFC